MEPKSIAIAVVEHEGRFLIGRRSEGAVLAGYAEFPGGKVQAGETVAAAACRECREETGLEVASIGSPEVIDWRYDHGAVCLNFVPCRVVASNHADIAEPLAPFAWVERAQLATLSFPPANAAVVARLVRAAAESAAAQRTDLGAFSPNG